MPRIPAAAICALTLLAAPAFAQTAPPSGMRDGSLAPVGAGMSHSAPAKPAPDPLKSADVSKITGAAVYGSDDKRIGSVSTELMKPETRTIDQLVVNAGGVLGVGGHHVALPISDFTWDAQRDGFRISKTGEDLKSMHPWQEQSAEAPSDYAPATPATPSQAPASR